MVFLKRIASPIGEIRIYSRDEAIVGLVMAEEISKGREQKFSPFQEEETGLLQKVEEELKAYFSGHLKRFTVPLEISGTSFQKEVWNALQRIQHGQLWTYAEMARAIGRPRAVRAIGGAVGSNPIPIIIPCHRVIGSDAKLTGFGGGLAAKQILLEIEGHRISHLKIKKDTI